MEMIVDNVNEAFSEIFWKFKHLGQSAGGYKKYETRNGHALVYPGIFTTIYRDPEERVLFHEGRDANPVFHLMESIWMLAGRNDVSFVGQFNRQIKNYSDDGKIFNAAYGHRWRKFFGLDQITESIKHLKLYPHSRQVVIQMWDPNDLNKNTIDKACNTQLIFDTRGDKLNMTVFNRSNDVWWGAYGANAVHFTFLQELISHALGLSMGVYTQISNNFHLYTDLYVDIYKYIDNPPNHKEYDYYLKGEVTPLPIMENNDYEGFLKECELFCEDPYKNMKYKHSFFTNTARPMALIYKERRDMHAKTGGSDGLSLIPDIEASDWRKALENWIVRRK